MVWWRQRRFLHIILNGQTTPYAYSPTLPRDVGALIGMGVGSFFPLPSPPLPFLILCVIYHYPSPRNDPGTKDKGGFEFACGNTETHPPCGSFGMLAAATHSTNKAPCKQKRWSARRRIQRSPPLYPFTAVLFANADSCWIHG